MPKKQPEPHSNPSLTCATCKWLTTPYRGKDCKERYGVNKLCRACIEYEMKKSAKVMSEIDKAKEDPFFRKIRKRLKTEDECQLDDNLEDEILDLQKTSVATLRNFTHKFIETNKDMIKLSKLFAQTQANRERINEIAIEMTYLLNNFLYPMRNLARAKLLTDYSELITTYKTVEDRNIIMTSVTGILEKRISRAENILEIAELAIKNLDQNYWSLKSIKEIGEGIAARRTTDAQVYK